jgi:hypothetical protein
MQVYHHYNMRGRNIGSRMTPQLHCSPVEEGLLGVPCGTFGRRYGPNFEQTEFGKAVYASTSLRPLSQALRPLVEGQNSALPSILNGEYRTNFEGLAESRERLSAHVCNSQEHKSRLVSSS